MTREEAIAKLKNFAIHAYPNEEFLMAIRALEQEPELRQALDMERGAYNALVKNIQCADTISRRAVIDMTGLSEWFDSSDSYNEFVIALSGLPPVIPQYTDAEIQKMQELEQAEILKAYEIGKEEGSSENPNRWIPVSERLPEVGSEVLVCYDFKGKRSVHIADFYGDGEFHGYDDEYLTTEGRKYRKAVAWMPLPLPYKASPAGAEEENE